MILSRRSKDVCWAIIVGLVCAIFVFFAAESGLVKSWELKTYDLRMGLAAHGRPTPKNVVMFYVDDSALKFMEAQGVGWPWPREVYSSILDFCRRGGARAVVFDFFYSEDSVYGPNDDEAFASGVKEGPPSYFVLFLTKDDEPRDDRFSIIMDKSSIDIAETSEIPAPSYTSIKSVPVKPLVLAAKGFGNAQILPDEDGVYRRIPLFGKVNKSFVPPLALKVVYDIQGRPSVEWDGKGSLKFGDAKIPLDEEGRMLINYYGATGAIPTFSLSKVLASSAAMLQGQAAELNPTIVKDKIVVIGPAAAGLLDMKTTPLSKVSPGAEIHATQIENLVDRSFITPLNQQTSLVMVFVFGLLAALGLTFVSSSAGICIWIVALIGIALGAGIIAFLGNVWLPVMGPVGTIALASFVMIFKNYLTEGRKKRAIRQAFGQYLSPHVVSEIAKDPDSLRLGGEDEEITVLFSDIADFTTISEKTAPTLLVKKLNEYFSKTTRIIQETNGTLDKYIGDAIMAFWGAPLKCKDHAILAVRAALGIQGELQGNEFTTRIGIHTGRALVGNIGSDVRFNYTAIGDTVNLSSRLEGLNKKFGTRVIISETTFDASKDIVNARLIGRVRVKGRNKPIGIYEPLGIDGNYGKLGKDACTSFEDAISLFEAGKFEHAMKNFSELAAKGDAVSKKYLDLCSEYIKSPPANFDAVITFTSK